MSKFLLLALSLPILFPTKAYAYVDLGTGSMIVQSIMAALVGGGIFFKDKIYNFISAFKKKDNSDEQK